MIDWDRILINVLAGLSILTALYLLLIGYRYLLKVLSTGKFSHTNSKFAELHTLVNNRAAHGEIEFLFMLTEACNVKFSIVDKDENDIEVLVEEEKIPGNYPISFNTTSIPDGIYFYQLKTDLQKISKVFKIDNAKVVS